ncbi:MAG: glycosyltransferase family 2 protein [Thiolinea sp.]
MASVQVLLSTWNGEAWLPELLDSLQQQSFTDWELLVRDDGSQDQTVKLLLEWQQQHPDKLVCLELDGQHLGSSHSFSALVEISTAPFLMFCDQDDVWFQDKIALEYAAITALCAGQDESKPVLVHSDLTLVNENKTLMTPSFWQWRGFDVYQPKRDYLLTNTVSGCAAIFNRAAAQMAFPLPQGVLHHDRWLGLVCAWFGIVHPLEQQLLFYRQHGDNAIGAGLAGHQHVSAESIPLRLRSWSQQAEVFLHEFGDALSVEDYCLIEALAELQHLKGWELRKHILQHRLFKRGVVANLALLWFA